MTKTLTAIDYDKIPVPGSLTIRLSNGASLQNSRSRAYQLAERRGDKITCTSDTDKMTLTITKIGKR